MPYDDDDIVMVANKKLEAIENVKSRAQLAQTNMSSWGTGQGQYSATFDGGLSEHVWTSPRADEYRDKIDSTDSGAVEVLAQVVADLTAAENAIYDAGEDRVPEDSPMARWPRS